MKMTYVTNHGLAIFTRNAQFSLTFGFGLRDVALPMAKASGSSLDSFAVADGVLLDPAVDSLVSGNVRLDLLACRDEVNEVGRR